MKTQEQKEKARERWRKWRDGKGWAGLEAARRAARESYRRKVKREEGREVRKVRGRPRIEEYPLKPDKTREDYINSATEEKVIKNGDKKASEEVEWDDRVLEPIGRAERQAETVREHDEVANYFGAKKRGVSVAAKKEEPAKREVVKTEVEKKVEADLERLLAKREAEWGL